MVVHAGLLGYQSEYGGGEDARAQGWQADEEGQGPHPVVTFHRAEDDQVAGHSQGTCQGYGTISNWQRKVEV